MNSIRSTQVYHHPVAVSLSNIQTGSCHKTTPRFGFTAAEATLRNGCPDYDVYESNGKSDPGVQQALQAFSTHYVNRIKRQLDDFDNQFLALKMTTLPLMAEERVEALSHGEALRYAQQLRQLGKGFLESNNKAFKAIRNELDYVVYKPKNTATILFNAVKTTWQEQDSTIQKRRGRIPSLMKALKTAFQEVFQNAAYQQQNLVTNAIAKPMQDNRAYQGGTEIFAQTFFDHYENHWDIAMRLPFVQHRRRYKPFEEELLKNTHPISDPKAFIKAFVTVMPQLKAVKENFQKQFLEELASVLPETQP